MNRTKKIRHEKNGLWVYESEDWSIMIVRIWLEIVSFVIEN